MTVKANPFAELDRILEEAAQPSEMYVRVWDMFQAFAGKLEKALSKGHDVPVDVILRDKGLSEYGESYEVWLNVPSLGVHDDPLFHVWILPDGSAYASPDGDPLGPDEKPKRMSIDDTGFARMLLDLVRNTTVSRKLAMFRVRLRETGAIPVRGMKRRSR